MDNELPKTSFSGRLKQVRFSSFTDTGKSLIDFVFPGFLGAADIQGGAGVLNRRRFAPAEEFPRGKYYSVVGDASISEEERIDDGGTMVGELRAYCDPLATGEIAVFDSASNTAYSRSHRRFLNGTLEIVSMVSRPGDIVIHVYDKARLQETVGDLSQILSTAPDVEGVLRTIDRDDCLSIDLCHDTVERSYSRVVDLRRPDTRVAVGQSCIELMSLVQPLPANHSFDWLDGLAILLDPHIGGNFVTTMIARRAAAEEADAIIFPSARNDFVATCRDGELEYFCGWNLVEVSGYTPSSMAIEPLIREQLPTRFSSGYMPQTRNYVRSIEYDEEFGADNPTLLLTSASGPHQGSICAAGLERRVERGYWESILSGRSRWGATAVETASKRQREDARRALELLDLVAFPSMYKIRRVMSEQISEWFSLVRARISERSAKQR